MSDIAVTREGAPSAVITLDKRFVSGPAVELLHTSAFTIVGKVTNVWRGPDDLANLYRRSVIPLLPSLAQTVTWGLLAMLASLASGLNPKEMEQLAYTAAGLSPEDVSASTSDAAITPPGDADESADPADSSTEAAAGEDSAGTEEASDPAEEIIFSDELMGALNPVVSGPAFQILPLAICS
jgi:hypothetical protein